MSDHTVGNESSQATTSHTSALVTTLQEKNEVRHSSSGRRRARASTVLVVLSPYSLVPSRVSPTLLLARLCTNAAPRRSGPRSCKRRGCRRRWWPRCGGTPQTRPASREIGGRGTARWRDPGAAAAPWRLETTHTRDQQREHRGASPRSDAQRRTRRCRRGAGAPAGALSQRGRGGAGREAEGSRGRESRAF